MIEQRDGETYISFNDDQQERFTAIGNYLNDQMQEMVKSGSDAMDFSIAVMSMLSEFWLLNSRDEESARELFRILADHGFEFTLTRNIVGGIQ